MMLVFDPEQAGKKYEKTDMPETCKITHTPLGFVLSSVK